MNRVHSLPLRVQLPVLQSHAHSKPSKKSHQTAGLLIIGQHQHTGIFLKRALIITTRVNPSLLPMGQDEEKFFCFSSLFCPRMIDKVGKLSYNNLWLHTIPPMFFFTTIIIFELLISCSSFIPLDAFDLT